MNIQRILLVAFFAAAITVALYLVMHRLVNDPSSDLENRNDLPPIEFTKVTQEEETQTRSRRIPKKPPPPKEPPPPPKLNVQQQQQVVNNMPTMNMPNLDVSLSGSGPFLGQMQYDETVDGGVIPIVRIAPQYPRKALIAKLEGWVQVKFIITEAGTVKDPQVVDSKPARIFDREALRAISKFKFKPKIVNGAKVEQVATQTIEFKLPDS